MIKAVLTPDREEKHQNGRRMKDDDEPMFTLTAQDVHGVAICPSLKIKEATTKGYADSKVGDGVNLSNPNSNTRRGRVGNGIVNTLTCNNQMGVVIDALYANRKPRESNICPTLRSERNGLLAKEAGECNNVRIRRLTPRECWRLQGFPDEYFDRAKAAGVSDSQLYKQAGNSVSVPVAYAIGLKLKEIEND